VNAIVAIVLGLWITSPVEADPKDPHVRRVVAKFNDLAVGDRIDFLEALAANGDVPRLTAIAKTELTFAWYAAREAVRILPAKEVVPYIKQFPPKSASWIHAMYGTNKQPKEAIVGYINALMKESEDPEVRYVCYVVCTSRGWDDLVPMTRRDLSDKRSITIPNGATGAVSLGKTAQEYLDSLKKSPRPWGAFPK
jgi:hypothetical protein